MLQCPLLEREIESSTCRQCMYRGNEGQCLNSVADTSEFARMRGVKPSDVDSVRSKAEQRIQAGLCMYEYLMWLRDVRYDLKKSSPVAEKLIAEPGSFLCELGVSPSELVTLADEQVWAEFQENRGIELPFRLSQVLTLTESQTDDLQEEL